MFGFSRIKQKILEKIKNWWRARFLKKNQSNNSAKEQAQRIFESGSGATIGPEGEYAYPNADLSAFVNQDYVVAENEYFRRPENWQRITNSTNVHSVSFFFNITKKYDVGVLAIKFQKQKPRGHPNLTADPYPREYRYVGVRIEIFVNILSANSKGRFVWQNIRDKLPFKRIYRR